MIYKKMTLPAASISNTAVCDVSAKVGVLSESVQVTVSTVSPTAWLQGKVWVVTAFVIVGDAPVKVKKFNAKKVNHTMHRDLRMKVPLFNGCCVKIISTEF